MSFEKKKVQSFNFCKKRESQLAASLLVWFSSSSSSCQAHHHFLFSSSPPAALWQVGTVWSEVKKRAELLVCATNADWRECRKESLNCCGVVVCCCVVVVLHLGGRLVVTTTTTTTTTSRLLPWRLELDLTSSQSETSHTSAVFGPSSSSEFWSHNCCCCGYC